MIIDCHYHLEQSVLTVDALIAEMDRCGVQKTALMGTMIPQFKEPPKFLISLLQRLLESRLLRPLGKKLISDFTPDGLKILGKSYPIAADPDNAPVFAAVDQHPDRFLGWVFINPNGRKDPLAQYEAYKDHPGFIGVKAHPFWHHFEPVALAPVAERLAATGKPLLLHVGFGPEGDFEALLAKVPGLKLVLAHAGFPGYADTWRKIGALKNVYLDLSQTSYTSERATQGAMALLGPDRLLFGTDGPYGFHRPDHTYDYCFIKRRIERMYPDPTLRGKLMGGNFMRLTGLA